MSEEYEAIHVHVVNARDMAVRTEEHEPEHFVMTTITLQPPAALGVQGQGPQLIAAEDPLRKDISIWAVDAEIVICHSPQQAASAGNQAAGLTAPDGAILAQGQSVTLTGSGRIYAACQTATRVSVVSNHRGA